MNGAHDMGGRMGFGPVRPEKNEPVFHAAWERRVFGTSCALGAFDLWNIDEDRQSCENRPPAEYVASSYYEIWLMTLERLLVEKAVLTDTELSSGKSNSGKVTTPRLGASGVMTAVFAPGSYHRDNPRPPAFAIGKKLRVRNHMTTTHTRLPGYLRGAFGTVICIHGCHIFPDSHARGGGEVSHWLYGLRFSADDVWGNGSKDQICADLWEPYLEPA
jgi:nitrile hydratase subunit beta